jgi:hypothetical protein
MFENAFILNLIFYIGFGSIVAIFIFYFAKEIRIKKKRQKEWDAIKEFFRCFCPQTLALYSVVTERAISWSIIPIK